MTSQSQELGESLACNLLIAHIFEDIVIILANNNLFIAMEAICFHFFTSILSLAYIIDRGMEVAVSMFVKYYAAI